MGAWAADVFENDVANDWACELEDADDLGLVSAAIQRVLDHDGYLDQDDGCVALGACEVVARCCGHPGQTDAYTERVDEWVSRVRPQPSDALRTQALRAIARVLAGGSELADLWEETGSEDWKASVNELRARLERRPSR